MATVIDALVVTLGLDASKFNDQQKQSVEYLRKLQEASDRHTKPANKAAQDLVGTFKELQGRLLAIGALIATGLGFNRLVQDITKANAELGRMSVTFGTTAQQLSEWQQAGRTVGAAAGDISAGIAKVNSEIQQLRALGTSHLAQVMGQVNIPGSKPGNPSLARDDNPDEVLKRLNRWYHTQDPAYAQYIMREQMGLPQGMINTLALPPEKLDAELKNAKRFAPTDAEIKKFQELQEAFAKLLTVVERLTTQALLPFVEALTKILKMLTDWLGKWADKNYNPAEAAGEGLSRMGLPELAPDRRNPSLFSGAWNWLRGRGWRGDQGGDGSAGANDNNAPAGFAGRFNVVQGGWQTNAQGQTRPAPPGAAATAGTVGAGETAAGAAWLAQQRAPFAEELRDPATRRLLAGVISAENPGAGPAVAESLMNRTMLVNQRRAQQGLPPLTLRDMMLGHPSIGGGKSFYGPIRNGAIQSHLSNVDRDPNYAARMNRYIDQALGGSNRVRGYTDQGSAGDPNYYSGGTGVNINGERFNNWGYPGSAQFTQGLMAGYDQASSNGQSNAGSRPEGEVRERPRVIIPTGNGFGQTGNQRAFENWRSLGLGASGTSVRGGDQSSIDNSTNTHTHVENLHVTPPAGASPSAYADGIQRRLSDFNNVQNSNTGLL